MRDESLSIKGSEASGTCRSSWAEGGLLRWKAELGRGSNRRRLGPSERSREKLKKIDTNRNEIERAVQSESVVDNRWCE